MPYIKALLILAALFSATLYPAYASDVSLEFLEDQLQDAVNADDFERMRELFSNPRLAESAYAIRLQGIGYDFGFYGLKADAHLAIKYYQKAHKMGDWIATYNLGDIYTDKDSPVYNASLGNQLIAESALKGFGIAQFSAAICYLDRDCKNAISYEDMDDWFSKDSDFLHPRAIQTLKAAISNHTLKDKLAYPSGVISAYSDRLNDEDFDPDLYYYPATLIEEGSFKQLEYWLEVGVAEKHSSAAVVLAAICYLDSGMCQDRERTDELVELVVSWSPERVSSLSYNAMFVDEKSSTYFLYNAVGALIVLAIEGDLSFALQLYHMLKNGVAALNMEPDPERSERWMSIIKAATPKAIFRAYKLNSLVSANTTVYSQYLTEGVTSRSLAEAFFQMAFEKKYPEALVTRAIENIKAEEYESALYLIEEAAYEKHPHANYILSILHGEGLGTEKNIRKSFRFAENAAYLGHAKAQLALAYKYHEGNGSTQDYFLAYAWSNQAAGRLDEAVEIRDAIEKVMTDAQLHRARMLSSEIRLEIDSLSD